MTTLAPGAWTDLVIADAPEILPNNRSKARLGRKAWFVEFLWYAVCQSQKFNPSLPPHAPPFQPYLQQCPHLGAQGHPTQTVLLCTSSSSVPRGWTGSRMQPSPRPQLSTPSLLNRCLGTLELLSESSLMGQDRKPRLWGGSANHLLRASLAIQIRSRHYFP